MNKSIKSLLAASAIMFGTLAYAGAAQAAFSDSDANNDEMLTSQEWVDYSFSVVDTDQSGFIEDTEWSEYTAVYEDDYAFNDYDTNGDSLIGEDEYNTAAEDGLFAEWDEDNDSMVNQDEYDTVVSMYEEQGEGKAEAFEW